MAMVGSEKKWISDPLVFFIWLLSGLIIAASVYHQHVEKAEICTLCENQRLIYLAIFMTCPLGFLPRFNHFSRKVLTILFLLGFSLSFYHLLIQMGFLTDRCIIEQSVENMHDFVQMLEKPKVACSTISWKLFGLSASFYNVLFSMLAAALINLSWLSKLRYCFYAK